MMKPHIVWTTYARRRLEQLLFRIGKNSAQRDVMAWNREASKHADNPAEDLAQPILNVCICARRRWHPAHFRRVEQAPTPQTAYYSHNQPPPLSE